MTDAKILLQLDDVSLKLGDVNVLDRLDLEVIDRVRPGLVTGQVVGVLGPSGVGKTRLLRLIAGLDRPDRGTIVGRDGLPLQAGEVGLVFQDYPLIEHRTVRDNLVVAGRIRGLAARAVGDRADELLERFGLADRAGFYPAQLSGGQRQRVAVLQQLVVPRELLLLDEPFSGLDPQALDEVLVLVLEVAHQDEFNTVLVVTHDVYAALAVSDTLFLLGRERDEEGTPLSGARVRATYDLVEHGLAWQEGVADLPAFSHLEREIRARFREL